MSLQDIRKGPPPDNGLEVVYKSASFNDRMLGHGEPVRVRVRVREGERVLFRLLNASATENVIVALPGHRFTVISLDGSGEPVWSAPSDPHWDYTRSALRGRCRTRDERLELVFEKVPGGPGGYRSLEHQRQAVAEYQSPIHHRTGETVPPRDDKQKRRQSPRPHPPSHLRGEVVPVV